MEQPLVRGLTIRRLPIAAAGSPGVILAVVSLAMLTMAGAGAHPMWRTQQLNMSEAAALRDAATVLQLLRAGESPREPRDIRPGFFFEQGERLTPLEAAIAAERPEIVDVLLGAGEAGTSPEWMHARCLAERVRAAEIERLLDAHRPPVPGGAVGDPDCTNVVRPW
jgi:hypothetical protein